MQAQDKTAQENNTVFNTLELYPNFETISVYALFTGDSNKNNSTEMFFREAGKKDWRKGHPLDRIRGGSGRWVGTIFWLTPNTKYEVKVKFTDPDGVTPAEKTGSIQTRNDKWPKGNGKTKYVSTEKGDDAGDGSEAKPFKTITKGAASLQPGDTLIVRKGVYREQATIQASGKPDGYTWIKAEEGAVLDSRDPAYDLVDEKDTWVSANDGVFTTKLTQAPTYAAVANQRLYGFDSLKDLKALTNSRRKASLKHIGGYWFDRKSKTMHVKLVGGEDPDTKKMQIATLSHGIVLKNSKHVVVEGFTIRYFANGVLLLDNVSDCVVRANTVRHTNAGVSMRRKGCNNNTFEDNDIGQFPSTAWGSWGICKGTRYETNCISVNRGRGTVVRRNKVHGSFNGIGLSDWHRSLRTKWNPQMRDTDIHENELYHIGDDALEPDGSSMNLRFWKNLCHSSWHPISLAPVTVGPCYVIRDVYWTYGGGSGGLKIRCLSDLGRSAGKCYVYHCTLHFNNPKQKGWRTSVKITRHTQWENFVLRNNILRGDRGALYDFTSKKRGLPVSLDGNCYHSNGGKGKLIHHEGQYYRDLAAFKKAGFEPNGIQADPQFVDPDNADATKADFRLKATSPCIDRAIPIPNINDDFAGKGPDIGAYEAGKKTVAGKESAKGKQKSGL